MLPTVALTYGAVWLLVPHQVNDVGGGRNKEDLHAGVVHRDEVHEQIDVPHAEHQQVDLLSLARQTYTHM